MELPCFSYFSSSLLTYILLCNQTSTSSISRGDEDINQPWPKTCKCGNDGLLNMLCSNYSEDSMEYRLIAEADSLSPDQSDQDEEQSIATPLLNSLNSTSSFKVR